VFHRVKCDSPDESLSSSIGCVPRLVEREIVDSSDDESQTSNGTIGGAYKAEQFVGYRIVPTKMDTIEDRNKVASVKSESSDNSKSVPC
jgi:hypothetical protein